MDQEITKENVPQHIAIIMDGNGRWAKKKGAARIFGHSNAIKAVRETSETCAKIGVKYLSLFAFSTENWHRPQSEVDALMALLVSTIRAETKTLIENDIRLSAIGDIQALPASCQRELKEAIDLTSSCKTMVLNLALSYSGRWDIIQAVKSVVKEIQEGHLQVDDVNELTFAKFLNTINLPEPELLIRTSGEMRISNFMLWQCAYTELYFTEVLWPDFRTEHIISAVADYQKRERRFGKISEQVNAQ